MLEKNNILKIIIKAKPKTKCYIVIFLIRIKMEIKCGKCDIQTQDLSLAFLTLKLLLSMPIHLFKIMWH